MQRIVTRAAALGRHAAAARRKMDGAGQRGGLLWKRSCSPWPTFQWRGMARYEGEMPTLGPRDFVVVSPEVSGAGGMSVPAELGEIGEMFCKVGDHVTEDHVVAVIDTCKASVDARCRAAGVIKEVLCEVGEEIWELQPLVVVTCDEDIEGKGLDRNF